MNFCRSTSVTFLFFVLLSAGSLRLAGQQVDSLALERTERTVERSTMVEWALKNHPLGQTATAIERRGDIALRGARGNFDPVVAADFQRKEFLDKTYYNYGEAGVSWQTPYAIKVESGYQWLDGIYTNPERNIPEAGQFYLSLKLPILRGLLNDKYRTQVKQAELAVQNQVAAAEILRNELRYDLNQRYLNWKYNYEKLTIYQQTQALIAERLVQTRALVAGGEKAQIDTLKAFVDLGNQKLLTAQASIDFQLAAQELQAVYWPLDSEKDRPEQALPLSRMPVANTEDNPILTTLRNQAAEAELERQLKREYTKPKLDLKYAVLGDGFDLTPETKGGSAVNPLTNAYKVGAVFQYPIFARSARSAVELADIKLLEKRAKFAVKQQEILQKVDAYELAVARYREQLPLALELAQSAQAILAAERELFALGESTQLTVNLREQYAQKAQLEVVKINYKLEKAIISLRNALGEW